MLSFQPPPADCPLCPRLCAFREDNLRKYQAFFNAPVPSFGELSAKMLVVGLAPGLQGANATGRPFTGDYAGIILYNTLLKHGFATGVYTHLRDPSAPLRYAQDDIRLLDCRITNAVRCVPPENKPEPSEIKNCNAFLKAEIAAMPNLKVILSLGLVSHKAVLRALGLKAAAATFAHGAEVVIPATSPPARGGIHSRIDPRLRGGDVILLNSYHCSRYNINTGRLTADRFDAVIARAAQLLRG